jgi:CheY-like chemotaxis protein
VIKVETHLEAGLPSILGNAAELREAMTNLIFNAVDAMPQGGTITIRTGACGSAEHGSLRVKFEVEDSGAGMDEDTRRRCLEPFFTTKGERGTGLGLAMVYGTAQRHKAELGIKSAPAMGTSISLEFPATQARLRPRRAIRAAEVPPLRLLLVDDDPAVLESTRIVLELDGHTVMAADGGAAGVETLREAKDAGHPFDAIVTDLGMPYVDGNRVAQAAKEFFPSATVVLLTGWGRKMGDHVSAHVDYTLSKPPDIDELRAVFAHRPDAAELDSAE